MRNKLKRSKHCEDTTKQSKHEAQTAEVITLVSESSCPNDEISPGSKKQFGCNAAPDAGFPVRREEERKMCCAKDIKIAPIFLFTAQQSRSKWRSDGEPQKKKSVLPLHSNDLQKVRGQQLLSTSKVSHLAEEEGPPLSTLSPSALNICLEEIQTSNPTFPVQPVFSTLQKKASNGLQHLGSTELSPHPSSLQSNTKEKRKRGNESFEAASKRMRCSFTPEGAVGMDLCHMAAQGVQQSVKKHPRSSKLSRTQRLRRQRGSSAGQVSTCELNSDHPEPDSHTPATTGSSFEDVLWTDKYSPQHSSEVIGNTVPVNKLHSWLKKWKLRADSDERKKVEERKREENSSDSWDCGDFQGEAGAEDDREETLCNTMLITGPPGVGKTASVYACAQELGFKVFEVNCSSQRSGRHVLSQLKEATQSHLVETPGKDPLKPAYFKNYTTSSCTPKSESLSGKTVHSKNVFCATKKRATQSSGRSGRKRKADTATVTLANYFKMKPKTDHSDFGGLSSSAKPETKKSGNPSAGCDQTAPQSKRTATSLILFEEVDVIFEDDVGFLAAIKTFMTTTKRPVILTTNDPSFRDRFSYSLEEIIFKTPPFASVCSYLRLVALAENVQLEFDDVSSIIRLVRGDVRRCLLQLQLCIRSSGGRASRSRALLKEPTSVQYSDATERGGRLESQVPPCKTGCTASMLGLEQVTQIRLLSHLKSQFWSETDMNKLLMLLTESWRGRVPLLYANLELLLPIRAKETVHCPKKVSCPGLQSELAPSDTDLRNNQLNGNGITKAIDSKPVKNISRLNRLMCDTTSSSSMKQRASLTLNEAPFSFTTSRNKLQQKAAKVETDSLDALTDFFDLMSYLDATLPAAAPLISGSCRLGEFVWTGAEIKDSMLDERSEEESRSWNQERLLNIQAAVEGLGCHKCCWRLSEAWTEAQKYRQKMEDEMWRKLVGLPADSKRQSLRFSVQPLCAPSVSQRRYELSRAVFGSESFSLLGNRQAVSVDYIPVLRSICRFQRAQQQKEEPVRYVNYLSGTRLGLSKSTMKLLADDF